MGAHSAKPDPMRSLGWVAVVGAATLVATARRPADPVRPTSLLVDPNTAPAAVLAALPNLGPARVRAILAAREAGPLRSIADLDHRVKGIGPTISAGLAPHLRFSSHGE